MALRILIVTPEFPLPTVNATRQRARQLGRRLGHEHDLHLLTFHAPGEPPTQRHRDEALALGFRHAECLPWRQVTRGTDLLDGLVHPAPHAYLKFRVPAFRRRLRQLVQHLGFDVVHFEINMTELRPLLSGREASVITPCDSFTKVLFRAARSGGSWVNRAYDFSQAVRFWHAERSLYPQFTKCQVVSQAEADYLLRLSPRIDTAVVPIGAEVPSRIATEEERNPTPDLVFSGQMSNPFTIDSVLWFVRAIWPRITQEAPSTRLWLVGRNPPGAIQALAKRDPAIVVTGFVDDVTQELLRRMVYVCPLLYGAGIKTRLLEAMAVGMPIVTTSIGAEGIDLRNREHVVIADTPSDFAAETLALLGSPEKRRHLGESAHALVKSKYSWETYARGMESLYEQAVSKHRSRTRPTT